MVGNNTFFEGHSFQKRRMSVQSELGSKSLNFQFTTIGGIKIGGIQLEDKDCRGLEDKDVLQRLR